MTTDNLKHLLRSQRPAEPPAQLDARVRGMLASRLMDSHEDTNVTIEPAFCRPPFGWQDWCYASLGIAILPMMALTIWLLVLTALQSGAMPDTRGTTTALHDLWNGKGRSSFACFRQCRWDEDAWLLPDDTQAQPPAEQTATQPRQRM